MGCIWMRMFWVKLWHMGTMKSMSKTVWLKISITMPRRRITWPWSASIQVLISWRSRSYSTSWTDWSERQLKQRNPRRQSMKLAWRNWNLKREILFHQRVRRCSACFLSPKTELETLAQWMKNQGFQQLIERANKRLEAVSLRRLKSTLMTLCRLLSQTSSHRTKASTEESLWRQKTLIKDELQLHERKDTNQGSTKTTRSKKDTVIY